MMIKKLKKKFILINMLLAALVLNISFVTIGISTYRRLYSESMSALENSFTKVNPGEPPKNDGMTPPDAPSVLLKSLVFNVKVSMNNGLTLIGNNVNMDNDELSDIVNACLKKDKKTGTVAGYYLRYMLKINEGGKELAFYDMSNDIHTMKNLIKNFALVEIGSMTSFFFISLFLAKWALRPLEISWNQQKQFVADASHELKTPLTVILANADILNSHRSDTIEHQVKWLDYIKAEAAHMSKLVNDLLFLANSDASREQPIFSKVNFSDMVWNCYLPFEPVAFEQGKELNGSIDSDIYISGDVGKIKQLIMILLDNACKYTEKGKSIDVSLKRKQDKIYFSVTNYGPPIAPEHLLHLFERFYRADESRTRETGGYGLGLSIAKTITDVHHGKISVTSSESEGTTFLVIFNVYK